MKKAIVAAFVVGASALYIFMRTPTASAVVPPPAQSPTTATVTTTSAPATASTNSAPPKPAPAPKPAPTPVASKYKDGSYTGATVDAYYGYVQVKATVSGGKLTDVAFLQYPNTHSTSVYINSQAIPMLKQEALAVQSANVNIISGATATSEGFRQSLSDALTKAANS